MILHMGNFVKRLYTGCKIFLIFVDILKPFPVGEGFLFGGGNASRRGNLAQGYYKAAKTFVFTPFCSPNKLIGERKKSIEKEKKP